MSLRLGGDALRRFWAWGGRLEDPTVTFGQIDLHGAAWDAGMLYPQILLT